LGNRLKNAYQKHGLIVRKPALGNIRAELFTQNYPQDKKRQGLPAQSGTLTDNPLHAIKGRFMSQIKLINLCLLVLFPCAWFAPLLRAGLLPLFGLSEITLVTGLQSLWQNDKFLAIIVFLCAFLAPYAKIIGLALVHFNRLSRRILPLLFLLGRLAMAEVFLIALYVTVIKGIGIGTVETAWGLYLLTGCILASLALSHLTARQH
jgi:paraquat-inducible protein A